MDQMDEAIAVFANDGTMTFSNATYHELWKMDPDASFAKVSIMDAARVWQDTCSADPGLGRDPRLCCRQRSPHPLVVAGPAAGRDATFPAR